MRSHGFSLIESLLGLSFLLLIVLWAMEFMGFAGRMYTDIQKKEENYGLAAAALDKIKSDLREGGAGLTAPIRLGAVDGVGCQAGMLVIRSRDESYSLLMNTAPGETRLVLGSTKGLKPGSELCLFDSRKAEACRVTAVDGQCLVLLHPVEHLFEAGAAQIFSLHRVAYFFDERSRSIKRKVNDSPAQPLLDDASLFECRYFRERNLASVRIRLNNDQEKIYDLHFFPKNTAIAGVRRTG